MAKILNGYFMVKCCQRKKKKKTLQRIIKAYYLMNHFVEEQCVFTVERYYKNNEVLVATV